MLTRKNLLCWLGGSALALSSQNLWAFGEARGVEGFRMLDATRFQVFSERGIGAFNLMAQARTRHKVCFFYRADQPFSRLEGVTITKTTARGDQKILDYSIKNGCVKFKSGARENLPVQIEFVDMYR